VHELQIKNVHHAWPEMLASLRRGGMLAISLVEVHHERQRTTASSINR
jgi:hypothetical protein